MAEQLKLVVVTYQQVKCKSFLHFFAKSGIGCNWGANPYRGCEHSCPYCFARYTHEYLGYNTGNDFDTRIHVKVNAAEVLDKELSNPRWLGSPVMIGSVCDPYQPAEKEFQITRSLLEVCLKHKNPVYIGTKSNLILRDLDLLSEISKVASVEAGLTITTLNEEIRSKIEPRASPSEKRLEAIQHLTAAGVHVGVLFMPIFPYLTDTESNICGVVSSSKSRGASWLVPGVLHLRSACRPRVLRLIRDEFPNLFTNYLRLYRKAYAPKDYCAEVYKRVDAAKRRWAKASETADLSGYLN